MKSKTFKVAGAGPDVRSAAPKSENHQCTGDEEHPSLSRVAARLVVLREHMQFNFDDDKSKNLCVFGLFLVVSVGLIVTSTVWLILLGACPTTSSFSGIVVPHADLPIGLPYLKYYWSVKETDDPLSRWISLERLPENALQTDAEPAYWVGVKQQYCLNEKPTFLCRITENEKESLVHAWTTQSRDSTPSRAEWCGRHHLTTSETESTEGRPLTLALSFKKYEFSSKYLSHYFKISSKKYPLLMLNAYTVYVKTDESDPLIFAARPDHFASLRALLEEIAAEDPDDGPDLSSECTIWPPGVEPKPQLPSMVLPAPTICPWETQSSQL